ncbi:MAG: hypothetical protein IT436_01320 [Phycisphaerales bacterium]|nr:hypothetical protein [Phycisphaerales bacterium]
MPFARRTNAVPLLILAAAAGLAQADICGYISRPNLSDLDQRRRADATHYGLGNDGNMYCVPTSCIDQLCYMSNHGYPAAVSTDVHGPQLWGSAAFYNYMGAVIDTMGLYLNTHPVNGTGNYTNGLLNYIGTNLPNDYIVIYSESFTPSHDLIGIEDDMSSMLAMGALVNLHIGWFERRTTGGGTPYWERTGGHVTALNGVNYGCTSKPKLYWRDPWNNSSLFSQASYGTSSSRLTFVADRFSWKDDPNTYVRFTYQIDAYTGSTKGFVGGYKAIWPNFGAGIETSADTDSFKFHIPKSLNMDGAPETFSAPISSITYGPVTFFDTHPSMAFSCAATNPPLVGVNDKLINISHGDGSVRQIMSYTSTAGPLTFGNDGELYAGDGSVLKAINPRTGEVRTQSTFVRMPEVMIFDDVEREIVMLDIGTRRIDRYNPITLALNSTWLLPAALAIDTDATLAISDETGQVWLGTGLGGSVYSLVFSAAAGLQAQAHSLPSVTDPRAIQITSKGDILVNDGGIIEEARRDPGTGRYVSADRTGLRGQRFAGDFRIARTRSTFDPATINLYDSHDKLPVEPLDCLADLNDDGLVDFADYLEFLNFYDAEDVAVDFTGDGLVDFADYLEFLNLYDAGC